MAEHYYTENPQSASAPRQVRFAPLGQEIACLTDAGTFSRDGLDRGTEILLKALPEISGRVLDLGCGWGPVGVTLGRKYPEAEILMTDINRRATELALTNLRENGVTRARVIQGDGFENVEGRFDFIITNPPIRAGKAVIYGLFSQAAAFLAPGGSLYIVIRKQQGAPSALKFLSEIYSRTEVLEKEAGFWVIRCGAAE